MEGPLQQICPSCGKQNPENARFCFACGTTLSTAVAPAERSDTVISQDAGAPLPGGDATVMNDSYPKTQPQYTPPASQAYTPPPVAQSYSPDYSSSPRRKAGRVRCCAVGCLVVLLVLLIGLPILHVTVLRPFIEKQIYKQVQKSLDNLNQEQGIYYGTDTESITEHQLNQDAQDAWDYIPGFSEGHIYLMQDQIKLELKVYGVKVWASADLRVDDNGYFVVKSLKMHWLLTVIFSESALKREIENDVNQKIVRSKGLFLLAFQVTNGNLFMAYQAR